MKAFFFKAAAWKYRKCLAPGMACEAETIRAHSIQNSRTLDLLAREGHVKGVTRRLSLEKQPEFSFTDIGKNQATTFTGFCGPHDTETFRPIDAMPLDVANTEQLFLLAYRAVAREMHAMLEAASLIQSVYKKGVEAKLDPGDSPSEAGLLSVSQIIKAYAMHEYKSILDAALVGRNFSTLQHTTFMLSPQEPAVAVASLFSLDVVRRDEGRRINVALSVLPTSATQTLVVFSYLRDDEFMVRGQLDRVFSASGDYQKYELSKLILNYCENLVVAPKHFDRWSQEKVEAITQHFIATVFEGDLGKDDERFFLF